MTTYETLLQLCKDYCATVAGAGTTSPLLCGKATQWNKAEDAVATLTTDEAEAMIDMLAEKHQSGAIPDADLMLYSLLEDKLHVAECGPW